jgi:hypothetical protein
VAYVLIGDEVQPNEDNDASKKRKKERKKRK